MNRNTDSFRVVLRELAIPDDRPLIVHAAFAGLSRSGYRTERAIDEMLDHLKEGTLMMPAMSWRIVTPEQPVFDELATPGITGALSERFRLGYATHRSLHPTHSVVARGSRAAYLVDSHHLDETPCSARSPFGRLVELGGYCLLIGVGLERCTLIHNVEEEIAPDLYLRPERETYTCIDRSGRRYSMVTRRHVKRPRDFNKFIPPLEHRRALMRATVAGVPLLAFPGSAIVDCVRTALRRDPGATFAVHAPIPG